MIPLSTTGAASGVERRLILRVAMSPDVDNRSDHVLVSRERPPVLDVTGFGAVLSSDRHGDSRLPVPCVAVPSIEHLADGDVVSLDPSGYVRTLYRRGSEHNALFATDRCNSYCLMCSQPPKKVDDSERLAEHFRLIDLIDPETTFLGVTGGEPTLFKAGFVELIRACKKRLPTTAVHVLTNGRLFYYGGFAKALGEVQHPDLMLGVPLYSDLDYEHDHVVQARNAFTETMVGLQNLGRFRVAVEIRVVVHRLTYERLEPLSHFIYANVPFAGHVTFMGLELMGFAVANLKDLWVDPIDYALQLRDAVFALADRGMSVSVYNHQLCTIPEDLWPFARRSISDWKNDYLPVCADCRVRDECGGFFTSSIERNRYSGGIHAVR